MVERLPEKKVIGATEARNKLGKLLNRVYQGQEHLVIEKLGIPVAVMISMRDYEHFRRLLAQEYHRELGRRLGREAEAQGLSEEELIGELEEDRRAVYEEMYGSKQ